MCKEPNAVDHTKAGHSVPSIKSCRSMAPAVASAVLFSLCELPGYVTAARSRQLVLAASLCMVLAALHTHVVLGKTLGGWRLIMPFQGGVKFMCLQAVGWILFACLNIVCICLIACGSSFAVQLSGYGLFPSSLGITQLVAQCSLVLSLGHFNPSLSARRSLARQAKSWRENGVPLLLVAPIMLCGIVMAALAIAAGGAAKRCAGWVLISAMLAIQAIGVHMMWTVTWNLLTLCSLLVESENLLAVMACLGVTAVCAPWYGGRMLFMRHNFPERAMIGLSAWASREMLGHGILLHKVCPWCLHLAFWHFDTVLHVLAAGVLLQHCAWSIRPVHVLASIAMTGLWGFTLSLRHNEFDWKLIRAGRLYLVQWGKSSLWEPLKVAQIYQFVNDHVAQDTAFIDSVPGFAAIYLFSNVLMAVVASLQNSGAIFFALGLGHFVSIEFMAGAAAYCFTIAFISGGGIVASWAHAYRQQNKAARSAGVATAEAPY